MSLPHTFFIGRSGGVAPIVFPGIADTLMSVQDNRINKFDISNWTTSTTPSDTHTSMGAGGAWPGQVADVAVDANDVAWVYTKYSQTIKSCRVDNFGGYTSTNFGHGMGSVVTLRNGIIVIHDTGGVLRSYTINTSGNLIATGYSITSYVHTTVRRMISPPDPTNGYDLTKHHNTTYNVETLGSYAGGKGGILANGTCTLITGSTNNWITAYRVTAAGDFAYTGRVQTPGTVDNMTFWPNGSILCHPNGDYSQHYQCEWPSFVPTHIYAGGSIWSSQAFATCWSRAGHNYAGGDGNIIKRGYDNATITTVAHPSNSNNQVYYGTTAYQTIPANGNYVPQYVTTIIGIGENVYWSGYYPGYGWTKVARFEELNGSGAQDSFNNHSNVIVSANTSSSYSTSQLLSGRPDWANPDEHFVEGWA